MDKPVCNHCKNNLHLYCGTSAKAVAACACAEKFHKG